MQSMEYIYCGGRFDFDYRQSGFEKKAAEDYRAILLKDVNKLLNPADTVVLSDNLVYIGPYYFETDSSLQKKIKIYYVKEENETESTLRSSFWYPMILCRKLNPADTEIESCDSFSEGRAEILKWLKSSLY